MKDQEPTRSHNLSDADMTSDCRERIRQARADLPDLTKEGLTAKYLDDFEQEVEDFVKLPDDDDLLYQQQAQREVRDEHLEVGRSALRDLLAPIRRAFGERSPQVKRFGAEALANLSVAEILNLLVEAQEVGTDYLTDPRALAEGFSQDRLDALPPAYAALKLAQKNFKDAEQARLSATRTRVLAYNRLDRRAINVCAKGYDHYVEHNEVKARAYVRQPSPGPAGGAAPQA